MVLLGGGCASPEALQAPCCYQGVFTLARLEQVRFVMNDGTEKTFAQVYKGFEAQNRDFPTQFPFRKINISGLTYDVLPVVFSEYDANQDGYIEEPELTVLYLREGAIGMNFKVSHLVVDERVLA
ncbi:MAG: hypothetical protein E4H01_01845, partial [Lysobacterales bacterium]